MLFDEWTAKHCSDLSDPVVSHAVSQDPREKRVTVDEVPSGVYLYPEEEVGPDSIFSPCPSRSSGTLFEEAKKEILKLMKIEVRHLFIDFYV